MQTSIVCSVCNKNNETVTDPDSGELICGNCGTVLLENIVETGPEWRLLGEGKDRSRTGMPTSLSRHDMGLATIIGKTNRDASGRGLDASVKSTMERLRTWRPPYSNL